jgi:tetratricopeptide (TPR) repeat protein
VKEKIMQHLPANAIAVDLHHGLSLFHANRFEEAEAAYKSVLDQIPGHPEALHMLGVLAYNRCRFDEACRFMEQADRLQPEPTEHRLCNFAIALAAAERNEEAVAVFRRALDTNPNLYNAHGRLSHALLKLGRLEEAAAAVVTAIRLKPDFGDSYFFLGCVMEAADRPDDALVAFREALRLRPESVTIANLLGNAFNRMGSKQEALACYRMALPSLHTAGAMRRESNAVLRRICALLTGRVLSIGSGHDMDKEGGLYREYFPACDSYIRIDFDGGNHPDIVGDAQNLRGLVPDQSCDVVFSIWALEHIPDVRATLAEIRRILRPGGAFVFGLPLNVDFHAFPHDYHRFTLDGIRELFRGAFHIEEVYSIGNDMPFVLDQRLSLIGALTETAPYSYVGLCRTSTCCEENP